MKSNDTNITPKCDDLTALPKRSRHKITAKVYPSPNKPNETRWNSLDAFLTDGSGGLFIALVNVSNISGISAGDLIAVNENLPAESGDIVLYNNNLCIKSDLDVEISGVVVCVIKSLPSHLRQQKGVSK